MLKKLIIFLVRKKLGLKKYQNFQFANQKNKDDYYYFTPDGIIKYNSSEKKFEWSSVSLNWLLNDWCEIIKL